MKALQGLRSEIPYTSSSWKLRCLSQITSSPSKQGYGNYGGKCSLEETQPEKLLMNSSTAKLFQILVNAILTKLNISARLHKLRLSS